MGDSNNTSILTKILLLMGTKTVLEPIISIILYAELTPSDELISYTGDKQKFIVCHQHCPQ